MCILTAMSPMRTLSQQETKIAAFLVTDLLTRNSRSSNRDGCGFSTIAGNLVKWAEPFGAVAYTQECNNYLQGVCAGSLIGHVRAISTGTKDDAHPFNVGAITLAHNGTFTNYRQVGRKLKMKETEMMDSRVLTEYLHQKVGSKALTHDHITKALDEFEGSYSLLIGDSVGGKLWVVAGSCALYIQQIGPLHVINTAQGYLLGTTGFIEAVTSLLYDETWVAGECKKVPPYTISVLGEELTQVASITPKKTKPLNMLGAYPSSRHHSAKVTGADTKAARTKAILFAKVAKVTHFSEAEATMACHLAAQQSWETASNEFLATLHKVFVEISDTAGTLEKEDLWKEIRELCGGAPYTTLAKEYDISFPYMWNSTELLQEILNEKRSALLS